MQKLRFGIISTGGITEKFVQCARLVEGAELLACASRTQEKADAYAARFELPRAYASYEALYNDPDIDVVYIATPHSRHKEDCLEAIAHGKHIICEKPLTLTKADNELLFAKAKEAGVFLMEAMWTRFLPTVVKAREWVRTGRIGELRQFTASFGFRAEKNPNSRFYSPALAGGALYDLGVYPLEFLQDFMRPHKPSEIKSFCVTAPTGVDETDLLLINYGKAFAQVSCTLGYDINHASFLYGEDGYINFLPGFQCPRRVELYQKRTLVEAFDAPSFVGFEFEIAHAVERIRGGYLTSDIITPEDTIECGELFDRLLTEWGVRK